MSSTTEKLNVLFLCTGNSCRSQMAEGWARALWADRIEAYSAGIETHGLNPAAVQVMAEAGIDISNHRAKLVDDLLDVPFDLVVTVCGHAHESCPVFPGRTRVVHVPFDDPPTLAAAVDGEAGLDCYRRVRDEIRDFVQTLPQVLAGDGTAPAVADPREQVRHRYAEIATGGSGCCCGTSNTCCSPDTLGQPEASAKLGYSAADLAAVPEGANMGLGCGNPQAIAALQPGETVLDMGCGGGFDCFLAARQVGAAGRVIGVDMTPEMLAKARANAAKGGYDNVDFRLGEIEHLPVADNEVDAILSNCVVNLSPDKPQVYREAFRVLRPDGRLAISDVVARRPLPVALRTNPDAYCGCVAGAATVTEIERLLRDIGFTAIRVVVQPESREFIKDWMPGSGVEDYVCSAVIEARKPERRGCCCRPAPTAD